VAEKSADKVTTSSCQGGEAAPPVSAFATTERSNVRMAPGTDRPDRESMVAPRTSGCPMRPVHAKRTAAEGIALWA
jgi:hypothetical protein